MHLTLTITLNIQRFVSSQHKVWIFCLQEKAKDIIQEKPCTHLRIYSTEFKIFILWFFFFFKIHPGTLRICVSSAQTFTRHAETVTTQGTLRRLWKIHWWAFGLISVTSCPPRHARHPWQEFPPPTSVFLEAPEDKAWRNGQGSSGTVLRNQTKLPARVSLWEQLPCVPVGEQRQSRAQERCLTEF